MTSVFGVDTSQVRSTTGAVEGDASALAAGARAVSAAVTSSSALPGGRTFAAVVDGARRVSAAVDGEAVVVDVIGTDLRSFAAAVDAAEQDAATSLSGAR